MFRGIRRIISVSAFVCTLSVLVAVAGDKSNGSQSAQIQPPKTQVAAGLLEVRIRRLHLVRPDLIPYPIAYEIIC
jgi:hypothetical protein